jgi:hypothetical protein
LPKLLEQYEDADINDDGHIDRVEFSSFQVAPPDGVVPQAPPEEQGRGSGTDRNAD